jgi:putative oxidoreductase
VIGRATAKVAICHVRGYGLADSPNRQSTKRDEDMAEINTALTTWAPRVRSILRIMTGLLLLQHGTQKYFNFPPSDYFAGGLDTLMSVAGGIELIGGVLIIIGLLTRPVAFICSGFSAAAYFMGHAPSGFFPVNNGGDLAILFCFVFLYFVFAGPGSWSVDAARGKA